MNIKHYKLLHFALIILLMLAPFRSVLAVHSQPCEMDDMASVSSADSLPHHDHITVINEQAKSKHQCCCCDDNNSNASCASNCDIGMTVSLVTQEASYAPVFVDVTDSIKNSSNLLIRALTPPSRPPAELS